MGGKFRVGIAVISLILFYQSHSVGIHRRYS